MSRFVKISLLTLATLIILFLAILILEPDCSAPEYLVNDFGGCELVD